MDVLVRWAVCGLLMASGVAGAQSAVTQQDVEAKLRATPFLILRGLWDCNSLHFDANGNLIGSCDAGPFSMSALVVKSVKLSGGKVEIKGNRASLVFGRAGSPVDPVPVSAVNVDKMTVSIERDSQHPEALDAALDKIFAEHFDDAVADAAPVWWQPWLRHEAHPDSVPPPSPRPGARPSLVTHLTGKPGEVMAPRLVRAPDPKFSEEARRKKFSGMCVVGLIVDQNGRARDLRIVQPIGMGLDDKAIQAVSQYEFSPATMDGKPVPVEINIEVNFRIY